MNQDYDTHALIFVPDDPSMEPVCVKMLQGNYSSEDAKEIFNRHIQEYCCPDGKLDEELSKDLEIRLLKEEIYRLQVETETKTLRLIPKRKRFRKR